MEKIIFEDIKENIKNGEYKNKGTRPVKPEGYKKENYVYDEEKSVKWNREHRIELEQEYENEWKVYRYEATNAEIKFKNDLIKAIMNEADLEEEQARIVYNKAYEDGHSEGLEEVVNKSEEYSRFVLEVINSIL